MPEGHPTGGSQRPADHPGRAQNPWASGPLYSGLCVVRSAVLERGWRLVVFPACLVCGRGSCRVPGLMAGRPADCSDPPASTDAVDVFHGDANLSFTNGPQACPVFFQDKDVFSVSRRCGERVCFEIPEIRRSVV